MENQPFNRLGLFIKLLLISVSVLLAAAIFIVFSIDYERFMNWILLKYPEAGKTDKLKSEYLTPSTYRYFRYSLLFLETMLLATSFALRKKVTVVSRFIYETWVELVDLFKKIKKEFSALTPYQKILFVLLVVSVAVSRIIYLFKYPLTNDEVFSYLFFVDKGFLVSGSYYPGPNNHIFFSELSVLTDIFLDDPLLIMRLPSLIAGVVFVFIFFIAVKKKSGFEVAILSSSFFAFSSTVFYYSIHGRGYALLSLFVLISLFSLLKITDSNKRIYKTIFAVSCVLGFYTVPVFLYPYLSFTVFGCGYFLVVKKQKEFKWFLVLNVLIAFFVLLIYFPVFLISGMGAVAGNSWVVPLSADTFWNTMDEYVMDLFNYLWGLDSKGLFFTLILLVAGVALFFKRKENRWGWCLISFITVPFIVLFIQKLQPFFRVWDYFMIALALLLAMSVKKVLDFISLKRIRDMALNTIVLGSFLFYIYRINAEVQRGFPHYTQLNSFLDQLFTEKPRRLYVKEDTYQLFLIFRAHEKNIPLDVHTENIPGDSLDTVILPSGAEFPSGINRKDFESYIFNMDINSYRKKK